MILDGPTAHLHPQGQAKLRDFLTSELDEPNRPQVILTTHAPALLPNNISSVIKFSIEGSATRVYAFRPQETHESEK